MKRTKTKISSNRIVLIIILIALPIAAFILGRWSVYPGPVEHKDYFPLQPTTTSASDDSGEQVQVRPTQYLRPTDKLYVSKNFGFSIVIPKEMETNEDSNSAFITLAGPNQKNRGALVDGIQFVFKNDFFDPTKQSFQEFSEARMKQLSNNDPSRVTSPMRVYTYDGQMGFTFVISSDGNPTYIYISKKRLGYVLEIKEFIVNITGNSESLGYQKMASQILTSLRVLK